MVSSMAKNHRKLFPTSTTTNQTEYCPYGCYPYSDFDFMPPPLPQPPPLLSADDSSQQFSMSPYVIVIVSLLASVFVLVIYYAVIRKFCSRRTRLRRPRPEHPDGQDGDFIGENRGPAIDHPIWFINTIGLQPSIINSITVFKFKKTDPLIEGSECSVCLSEFQENETLRLLPKCNHAFHIPCIDTWLRSHTNCPVCRAGIVSNTLSVSSGSNQNNSSNLNHRNETQMENFGRTGELGDNLVGDSEVHENRAETECEIELLHVGDESKELGDSNSKECLKDKKIVFERDNHDVQQPVLRRSVSVDSSVAAVMNNFCMDESGRNSGDRREDIHEIELGIVGIEDRENLRTDRVNGSPSIGESMQNSPVSMERSVSCGGRLFLSGYNSRNSSSILPL